jgi:serine/threonine protein kinase
MEYENWKIDPHDISIATSLGTGTYGEVSRGTYKRYEVAVKKIIPHNSTESRTATEVSIPASNNSRKNGILPLWTSKKENSASKKEDHKAQEKIFDKFEAEIRLMCGLRHPNIVTFMGACLTKPNMLLVTEFCEIGSLFDFLVDPGYKPIDFYKKLDFVCGSAYGLQYLHSQEPPILHRDFKSLSILIDVHFNVKVCDFGLSQFASEFQRGSSAKPRRVSKRERKVKEESEVKKIVGSIPWVGKCFMCHYVLIFKLRNYSCTSLILRSLIFILLVLLFGKYLLKIILTCRS